jgi:hypothetical protein
MVSRIRRVLGTPDASNRAPQWKWPSAGPLTPLALTGSRAALPARRDFKKLVKIIKDGGYRGYFPIETLSARGEAEAYDPAERVTKLLAELKEAINQTG